MSRMTSQPREKIGGAWCPMSNGRNECLEVDLQTKQIIWFIKTRGCDGKEWYVKSYRLQYATDRDKKENVIYRDVTDANGEAKVFEGNSDNTSSVQHSLGRLEARYVKIIPVEFQGRKALRWELYAECTFFLIHMHMYVPISSFIFS